MPTVGKKKFKYDEEGMAAAEAEAAATGQEVASEEEAIDNIVSDLGAEEAPVAPEEVAETPTEEEPPMATVPPEILSQLFEAVHGIAYDPDAEGAEAKMHEIEAVIAGNPQVAEGLSDGSVSLTEAALVLFRQVELEGNTPQNPAPEMAGAPEPDVGAYL